MFDIMGGNHRYNYSNYGQMNLMNGLRKLWMEHVFWTRLFIISAVSDLPDLNQVTKRLLRNPSDFADVLEIYYGKDKADTFRSLLEDHLKIAASIVSNAKTGNTKAVDQFTKKWYDNADSIADFLASINPYWDKDSWIQMLHEHLKLTMDEAVARLGGESIKDILLFDMVEEQALAMADMMTEGMIKQFKI